MAIRVALICVYGVSIQVDESPEMGISDHSCDEIRQNSEQLQLHCLRYIDGAESCVFNYGQCQDILKIEIPALRTSKLSEETLIALNELEKIIQEMENPYGFLFCEGD